MRLRFYVRFSSAWGEQLYLSRICGNAGKVTPMAYLDAGTWWAEIEVEAPAIFSYRYLLNGLAEKNMRSISLQANADLSIHDVWIPPSAVENIWLTAPFRGPQQAGVLEQEGNCIFRVLAPPTPKPLHITGNAPQLGGWDTKKAVPMHNTGDGYFSAAVQIPPGTHLEYKYLLAGEYETGENRTVITTGQTVIHDAFTRFPTPPPKAAGVAVPVFSLRSGSSCGVGEFNDIRMLADWAEATGQRIIQLLPVNDTTVNYSWTDSYPYAVISAFALHPVYVHLPAVAEKVGCMWPQHFNTVEIAEVEEVAEAGDSRGGRAPDHNPREPRNAGEGVGYGVDGVTDGKTPDPKNTRAPRNEKIPDCNAMEPPRAEKTMGQGVEGATDAEKSPGPKSTGAAYDAKTLDDVVTGYNEHQSLFNAAPLLDYEAVMRYKMQCLEALYAQHQEDDSYRQWVNENNHWLQSYAAFCCRRDRRTDAAFFYFIQYHLHLQLSDAVNHARNKGITLKGDLPIGLSLQSADVMAFPALFHTGLQAGAPPDEFAEKGQNWGFPTYNWPAMEAEDYGWWKKRLRHMAQYFSAFRIDHLLGFFRIWQIPRHARDGLLGYFEPALPFTHAELQQWGIPFDRERYCAPYITDAVLYDIFSSQALTVKAVCLEPSGDGHYRLLPSFRTQAQVLGAGLEPAIEEGLLALITNVLFLEPQPGQFHPRFNLHRTSSFEALDDAVQQRLSRLADHFFYHRHNELWEQEALRKLPALQKATDMLVCGEDLGMVPRCVPGVMQQLGILSLEVQYMPKQRDRGPADAPYLSVVTPSSHDMPTLREWKPGKVKETLAAQLQSPAMWCIPQLQDWLALDDSLPQLPPAQERINNPAVMPWYWRYRMPLSLEALLQAQSLNSLVASLVRESGR